MRSTLFKQDYDPETKLWVAQNAQAWAMEMKLQKFRRGMLQRKSVKRTIYDQYGNPVAQVKVHDSGNTEAEFDSYQDATARPDPIQPRLWDEYEEWMKRREEKQRRREGWKRILKVR